MLSVVVVRVVVEVILSGRMGAGGSDGEPVPTIDVCVEGGGGGGGDDALALDILGVFWSRDDDEVGPVDGGS